MFLQTVERRQNYVKATEFLSLSGLDHHLGGQDSGRESKVYMVLP